MNRMSTQELIATLLKSSEPSIRWKVRSRVLGESPSSKGLIVLAAEIRRSRRVTTLLSRRDGRGRLVGGAGVYAKWQGAHWVLATLADIGYPAGDRSLLPVRDQICETWLADHFYAEFEADQKKDAYKREGVVVMHGRYRRCASQQGNALYFLTELGLADDRAAALAERLLHWRWPDRGWNCDKDPAATHSSFTESLLPMKGLFVHSVAKQDRALRKVASQAAELFLARGLFRRLTNGKVIKSEFTYLHYPLYWHYDILAGLKAMADMDLIRDPRCAAALDWLEGKQLPGGGWPAERRYYKASRKIELGADDVDWGGASRRKMNEWVTADALYVLRAAGRLDGFF
jgi:hypothetical protein